MIWTNECRRNDWSNVIVSLCFTFKVLLQSLSCDSQTYSYYISCDLWYSNSATNDLWNTLGQWLRNFAYPQMEFLYKMTKRKFNRFWSLMAIPHARFHVGRKIDGFGQKSDTLGPEDFTCRHWKTSGCVLGFSLKDAPWSLDVDCTNGINIRHLV